MEVLARALIMEGKYAYVGQDLTGLRSLGTNSMIVRCSDTDNIPPGTGTINPDGVMLMNEALIIPNPQATGLAGSPVNRFDVLSRQTRGTLMVCTSKDPGSVAYPVDFHGTVATVDADAIFNEIVGTQPAIAGITSLGLFSRATGVVKLETLIRALMEHERLGKRTRQANVACVEAAYERTKLAHGVTLTATRVPREDPEIMALISTLWQNDLPVCDTDRCVCSVCLAAVYCPEAVISWEDEAITIDFDRCKSCGTCVRECPRDAMRMESGRVAKDRKPANHDA